MERPVVPYRVIHKNNLTVVLSPMCEEDYIAQTKWMNDFSITKFIGRNAKPISYDAQKEWVDKQQNGNKLALSIWVTAPVERPLLIGNCSLIPLDANSRAAILGIVIGETAYWNKGIASDVVKTLLEIAFLDMNLHSVNLTVDESNIGAIKCYEKNGFKRQGIMRDRSYYDGVYHNEIYMDVIKEEWENSLG